MATHRESVLRAVPGARSERDGNYTWHIRRPDGTILASGGSSQQAWYCARIFLANEAVKRIFAAEFREIAELRERLTA
jgi:hypothetical protein